MVSQKPRSGTSIFPTDRVWIKKAGGFHVDGSRSCRAGSAQASFKQLKILAIKFKYLGDVAVMTPALRALREQFPRAELHVSWRKRRLLFWSTCPGWTGSETAAKRGKMALKESCRS